MLTLYIGYIFIAGGLIAVIFLLWNEHRQESPKSPAGEITPSEEQPLIKAEESIPKTKKFNLPQLKLPDFQKLIPKKKTQPIPTDVASQQTKEEKEGEEGGQPKNRLAFLAPLLNQLKFFKKSPAEKPSLLNFAEVGNKSTDTGTASLRLDRITADNKPSPPIDGPKEISSKEAKPVEKTDIKEEKSVKSELEIEHEKAQSQLNELKEKYNKLQVLFDEKSEALIKAESTLENELKHRKEFNKVKDLLDKELKDSRDKYRQLEIEHNQAQTEIQSFQKRINQLNEKLEKSTEQNKTKQNEIDQTQQASKSEEQRIANLNKQIKSDENKIKDREEKIRNLAQNLADPNLQQEPKKEKPPGIDAKLEKSKLSPKDTGSEIIPTKNIPPEVLKTLKETAEAENELNNIPTKPEITPAMQEAIEEAKKLKEKQQAAKQIKAGSSPDDSKIKTDSSELSKDTPPKTNDKNTTVPDIQNTPHALSEEYLSTLKKLSEDSAITPVPGQENSNETTNNQPTNNKQVDQTTSQPQTIQDAYIPLPPDILANQMKEFIKDDDNPIEKKKDRTEEKTEKKDLKDNIKHNNKPPLDETKDKKNDVPPKQK